MKKRTFRVSVTILFIVSMLLVSLAPITAAALSKEDKEYIEVFNDHYEIIRKDVEEAEDAYYTGSPEVFKEKVDEVSEDTHDAFGILLSYTEGTSKELRIRVQGEVLEASKKFESAKFYACYKGVCAYSYDREASFENLKKGMEHLEKAKSLLPESKVPGFSAILAIAGLLAVAYLLRRRK